MFSFYRKITTWKLGCQNLASPENGFYIVAKSICFTIHTSFQLGIISSSFISHEKLTLKQKVKYKEWFKCRRTAKSVEFSNKSLFSRCNLFNLPLLSSFYSSNKRSLGHFIVLWILALLIGLDKNVREGEI